MIKELEVYDNGSGFLVPKIAADVHLPTLTTPEGGIVSPSGQTLSITQPYIAAIDHLVMANLFVGVQMLDDNGDSIFRIVTTPNSDIYQILKTLQGRTRLFPGNLHNQDYAILPLINPF